MQRIHGTATSTTGDFQFGFDSAGFPIETPEQCFVGLFDILGFQRHVEKVPIRKVQKRMEAFDRLTNDSLRATLNLKTDPPGLLAALNDRDDVRFCGMMQFSDTILLYAPKSQGTIANVIIGAHSLVQNAMKSGIPIRGALTTGELFVDREKQRVLGGALVTAYRLEQRHDWAGAIIDSKLAKSVPKSMLKDGRVVKYPAPCKDGDIKEAICIGWPHRSGLTGAAVRRSLESFNGVPTWSAKRKLDNTTEFVDWYAKQFPETWAPRE